jgi:hypothetical protein
MIIAEWRKVQGNLPVSNPIGTGRALLIFIEEIMKFLFMAKASIVKIM